ncbi:hypothetical protein E2P81_ATG11301 [Venturia nashicola]|nr:hypothetical protein E2P81_ATG11301 [Venturia nashicola]
MSNSTQPPVSPLTQNPRARCQKLINGDFKARYNAAMVGFDAFTTGQNAIPIHPYPTSRSSILDFTPNS